MDVNGLLRARRLEAVPADAEAARARIAMAEQHLTTAELLLDNGSDLEMAYVALYDAARKSVTAAMLAAGLRATARAGAHEAVAVWCAAVLGKREKAARRFDSMRRRRNKAEYTDVVLGVADVQLDLADAADIVAAARAEIGRATPASR